MELQAPIHAPPGTLKSPAYRHRIDSCVFYFYLQPTLRSNHLTFYYCSPCHSLHHWHFLYCSIFIFGHLTIMFWSQRFHTVDVCHDPLPSDPHSFILSYLSLHACEPITWFSNYCLSLHWWTALVTPKAYTIAVVLKELSFLLYQSKLNITGFSSTLALATRPRTS